MGQTGSTKGTKAKVLPSVKLGKAGAAAASTPLPDKAVAKLTGVVVHSHLRLPDMFELTFADTDQTVTALSGVSIGSVVELRGGNVHSTTSDQLIVGEVTCIETGFADTFHTVVRGYAREHRLQRGRHTRTFANMKDSDIVAKVAKDAGLALGSVAETRTTYEHVGQINQTDWEFLTARVAAIGYELGTLDGKLYLREAASTTGGGKPVPLGFPAALRTFTPRLRATNLAAEAEVRGWDPMAAKVISATVPTTAGSVAVNGHTPATLAGTFAASPAPPATPVGNPALGDLGPAPVPDGHVLNDRTLAAGSASDSAAREAVRGAVERVASGFAEADGEADGDPRLLAGAVIEVSGVSATFCGKWVITGARHVFGDEGYRTTFEVTGRQDRSMFGLVSGGAALRQPPAINGLVCGIVSNINDPLKKCRVKVILPWLSPTYESNWAPVAQLGAGKRSGVMFLPEVTDEVLVGFEFGDPQRPYVLAGIVNDHSGYTLGGEAVKAAGETAAVAWRGIVSGSGNRLAFHDEAPPGPDAPPSASELVLGTASGNLSLTIDQVAGTVVLKCDPAAPNSKSSTGQLTIQCGAAGVVNIKTGAGGRVDIDGGDQLSLTASKSVSIQSQGVVEIKGKQITLN